MERRPLKRKALLSAHRAKLTQAERVARRFGGTAALYRALNANGYPITRAAVYRWNAPKELAGTGGRIPSQAIQKVINTAFLEGILLTQEDLDPRETEVALERYEKERIRDGESPTRAILSSEKNEVAPESTVAENEDDIG